MPYTPSFPTQRELRFQHITRGSVVIRFCSLVSKGVGASVVIFQSWEYCKGVWAGNPSGACVTCISWYAVDRCGQRDILNFFVTREYLSLSTTASYPHFSNFYGMLPLEVLPAWSQVQQGRGMSTPSYISTHPSGLTRDHYQFIVRLSHITILSYHPFVYIREHTFQHTVVTHVTSHTHIIFETNFPRPLFQRIMT